jgi:membrane protein
MADPVGRPAAPEAAEDVGTGVRSAPPPPPPKGGEPAKAGPRRLAGYLGDVVRGTWRKGQEDDIFFLAGAISFNVLVAFIPLALAVLGIAGTVLTFLDTDAQQALLGYLRQTIPAAIDEDSLDLAAILQGLAERSTGILSVGTLFFLWIATRLVGTLRVVLRQIFDLAEGRSIVAGKLFDIKMVLAAGTLFALNVALTLGLRVAARIVPGEVGIDPAEIPFIGLATNVWPQLVAFVTLWVMFLLIYRYLPPRRIRWNTALVAATFTSILVEVLKYGFSWYVTEMAHFGTAWGNLATFVILVFWIYYTSVVFILGGQVAQVVSMRRVRSRQKQRLT